MQKNNSILILIFKSILAGVLIGFAACIYMSCQNAIVGALLFSLGLISVIVLQASLFTGKVGYATKFIDIVPLAIMLIFNLLSAFTVGWLYSICIGAPVQAVANRFIDFVWYKVLFKSIGTGAAIYLAVELNKKTGSFLPVVLGVMGFILGGMLHVVADAAYLGAVGFTPVGLLYLLIVAIGNSIGSLLIRQLQVKSTPQ